MLDCRKCSFKISGSMRHALVNNCCPSCGSAILGDTYTQRLKLYKNKLMQQEFAEALSEDLIFDFSMFMLLEFSPPSVSSDEDSERSDSEVESSIDQEQDEYERIREEIREEVASSLDEDLVDADEDLKIARLKRLARESKTKITGPAVRRLGSD